jgi:hypothetical protein
MKKIIPLVQLFAFGCVFEIASAQTNQYPFQNPNLPVEDRVSNVV